MSTLHQIVEFQFHNNKPSKKQIMACINNAIKGEGKAINISWGENCLELVWHDRQLQWYGYGWIKNIGGSDIADELNNKQKTATTQFMAEHFKTMGSAFI